jgi:uncharacterized membrane protein HdeD (DUF308 family)
MDRQCEERACFLRRALMGNALFSILSGLTILFAKGWVLRVLGLSNKVSLLVVGVALIVFAATLGINARKQKVNMSDAWMAVWMDVAWVIGSYVLIIVGPFSTEGKWVVGVVAELVFVFAVLQFLGIRRIQKSEQFGRVEQRHSWTA